MRSYIESKVNGCRTISELSNLRVISHLPNVLKYLKIVVGLGIIAYIFSKVDLKQSIANLGRANVLDTIFATILMGISLFFVSVRWRILMNILSMKFTLARVNMITLIGHFFNSFLFGSTGGDLIKALYLLKNDKSKLTRVFTSILVDRVMGLMSLIVLSIFAININHLSTGALGNISNYFDIINIIFVIAVIAIVTILYFPLQKLPQGFHGLWLKIPFHQLISQFYLDFKSFRSDKFRVFKSIIVSFIGQIFAVSVVFFIARSLNIKVDFPQMLVVVSMVFCLIALPISIGGHGVREASFVMMFVGLNIVDNNDAGKALALSVSFIYLFITLFWSIVGGVLFIIYRDKSIELKT